MQKPSYLYFFYYHTVFIHTNMREKFSNISVHVSLQHIYHMTKVVQVEEGIMIVVCAMTSYALLHSVKMNMQQNPIWELMLHSFELSHDTTKATKNTCCAKVKDVVDHRKQMA